MIEQPVKMPEYIDKAYKISWLANKSLTGDEFVEEVVERGYFDKKTALLIWHICDASFGHGYNAALGEEEENSEEDIWPEWEDLNN